jgi:MoaA/NifB/PqqE/SkfB family radical SAM enzyme
MWLHVEPTSRCNAWCPSCPRNLKGYGLADIAVLDLDPQRLRSVIEEYNIQNVQMCGNIGDPCAATNINEQFDILTNIEKLQIHTNGSLRKSEWWASLPKQFNDIDIWFALDGIGDVHSYYRQGTDYDKIIKNATAFIEAGGNAVWQFIPFAHNEHQIMECMKLSQKLGFKRFEFVRNARYLPNSLHYKTGQPLDIKPWSKDKRFNSLSYNYNSNPTMVPTDSCMHLSMPSIFLNAKGKVTPCCYMQDTNLKDIDIKEEFSNNVYRDICLRNCG